MHVAFVFQRLQQVEWLVEVRNLREVHEQVTMYALRRLINVGIGLPPHASVEQALTQLQVLLRAVEDWQDRAKSCLDLKYVLFFNFTVLLRNSNPNHSYLT